MPSYCICIIKCIHYVLIKKQREKINDVLKILGGTLDRMIPSPV